MKNETATNTSTCGCCEGRQAYTPVETNNPAGQASVARRVGTHGRFKQTMLARLSSVEYGALRLLTTREDDDWTIALIDAWATVADVLTFYQERSANEGYLRTAQERRSLANLARTIGYEPRPGVAAQVYLAFSVEDAEGAPPVTTVPAGTKIQSVPNPGERPQTFETGDEIEARAAWNAIKPVTHYTPPLKTESTEVTVQGIETTIRPGDRVVIASSSDRKAKRVVTVETDAEANLTRIRFAADSKAEEPEPPDLKPITLETVPEPRKRDLDDQSVHDLILIQIWEDQDDLFAYALENKWPVPTLVAMVNRQLKEAAPPPGATPDTRIFAMRQRAAVFGHNAPNYNSLPYSLRKGETVKIKDENGKFGDEITREALYPDDWEEDTLLEASDGQSHVDLDRVYADAIKDSWIVLMPGGNEGDVIKVTENTELSRSDYTLSAKVSRLTLKDPDVNIAAILGAHTIRGTTVYVKSEPLTRARVALTGPLAGNSIQLDRFYDGLRAGRSVIVSGESVDLPGVTVHEVAAIKQVSTPGGRTHLEFEAKLAYRYRLETVVVNANVVRATHGETQVDEPIGSGDGALSYQTFALAQAPLTYVPAESATGAATTLELRVNRLLWSERETLYGAGPEDRVYVTQRQEDGTTLVKFGNGVTGRRLPTGQENVRVTYRKGIGLEGRVGAEQLKLLQVRPHGVRSVVNPLPAFGGADAESEEEIRTNATLGIRTLGRIVSLQDYEDFSRAFAGVAKALATWTWTGQGRGIFVTVAGPKGADVAAGDLKSLANAMKASGDPLVRLTVASYTPRFFLIEADVQVDPAYIQGDVLAAVEAELRERFSFARRQFGQPVAASEVIAAIHAVKGVLAVDLNDLRRTGEDPMEVLPALVPQAGSAADKVDSAELLTLDARPISLGVMT